MEDQTEFGEITNPIPLKEKEKHNPINNPMNS